MEKSEYIILLERFLKGETTHDEERILVDWFKSDVSRDELRNYIQRKWEIASNSSIPTDLKERMFRKIQSRIESIAVEKKEVGRFSSEYHALCGYWFVGDLRRFRRTSADKVFTVGWCGKRLSGLCC